MNKKLLLAVSVGAAVLIVFISFTSVVGFQSTKSGFVDTPLFGIRTQRAIQKESNDVLTFDYLGKGQTINIIIPRRESTFELVQRIIERIQEIDDETYEKKVNLFIHQLQQEDILTDVTPEEITNILYQFKENPDVVRKLIMKYLAYYKEDNSLYSKDECPPETIFGGCIIVFLAMIVIVFIYFITAILLLPLWPYFLLCYIFSRENYTFRV
jgi:hypothetical protein